MGGWKKGDIARVKPGGVHWWFHENELIVIIDNSYKSFDTELVMAIKCRRVFPAASTFPQPIATRQIEKVRLSERAADIFRAALAHELHASKS